MESGDSVSTLIERIRRGDEEAAAALVERYEPELRREVRLRLNNAQLRTVLDSLDICQSVLASFFLRTSLGQYRFDTPRDVVKLLSRMARNKVVTQCRRQHAAKRDLARTNSLQATTQEPPDQQLNPAEQVALRELVDEARCRLNSRERQLADLRRAGCSWDEIADRVGGAANGQCRTLSRAVARISQELNLDE